MPAGFDTVAMQEDIRIEESAGVLWALIPPDLKKGANRRRAGEDSQQGERLVAAGTRLRPQDVASAAAVGMAGVDCYARLKVAILSTGDEILRPGEKFSPGKVYDANSSMLQGLIAATGADAQDLGVLPDRAERVRDALDDAAQVFDVVIVSGGASQGAEDHVVKSLDAIGKRHLWQIAIKPGRPMSFGQIGDCVVLSLPGNPVAVFVCFLMYARPVLVTLGGGLWPVPQRFRLPAAFTQKKKVGRREFWRAKLSRDERGRLHANKFPRDGSGLISSLREADGLIEVPEEVGEVRESGLVDFIPFSEFGI
jgi:molybdopterin molybdotransferase